MIILCKRNPVVNYIIFSVICTLITIFFIYQIFKNDTLGQIENNKEILHDKLEKYEQINAELLQYDSLVNSLSPHSLDTDFLSEEARKKLLYSKKNEIIIFKEDLDDLGKLD